MWASEGTQSEVTPYILKCITVNILQWMLFIMRHQNLAQSGKHFVWLEGVSRKECDRTVIPEKVPDRGRPAALATFEWQPELPRKHRQVGKTFHCAWRTRVFQRKGGLSARWLWRQTVDNSPTQLKLQMSLATSLFLNTTHDYLLLLLFSFYDLISKLMLRKFKTTPLVFRLELSDSKSDLKQFWVAEYWFCSCNKQSK